MSISSSANGIRLLTADTDDPVCSLHALTSLPPLWWSINERVLTPERRVRMVSISILYPPQLQHILQGNRNHDLVHDIHPPMGALIESLISVCSPIDLVYTYLASCPYTVRALSIWTLAVLYIPLDLLCREMHIMTTTRRECQTTMHATRSLQGQDR